MIFLNIPLQKAVLPQLSWLSKQEVVIRGNLVEVTLPTWGDLRPAIKSPFLSQFASLLDLTGFPAIFILTFGYSFE